jgi:pyruvate kinase
VTIAFRDTDVSALFKDFGVPITIDGNAGVGLVDENDTIIVSEGGRGAVVGAVTTVTVQTSAFPTGSLKEDKPIVVDGVNYTIRQRLKEGDAALTKILIGSV